MKAHKNILLLLSLTLILSNNISYASEEYPNQINPAIEENNVGSSSDEMLDEIAKENDNLINFIEDFKKSTNYLDSSGEIKILYDNAINFYSRALDKDNYEWLVVSRNNLIEDINLIEKIDNSDYQNREDINIESKYFNNPLFKIAYLKLDKSKQDILDDISKEIDDRYLLTISDLANSDNEDLIIFFSDWIYPFMDDEDNDGVIASSRELLDSIKENKNLFDTYKNTNFDERCKLVNEEIGTEDNNINSDKSLISLLTTNYQNKKLNNEKLVNNDENMSSKINLKPETVVLGEDAPNNINDSETSKIISENIEKSNNFQDSDDEYHEDNLVKEETIQSDNSIFSTHKKTKEAYAKLSDDQKQKLNEMNTDGKYPLTIDEVKRSGEFKIPVKSDVWIYPFMIDRNNSGEVGEYDGEFDNMEPSETSKPSSDTSNNDVISDSTDLINTNEISTSTELIENNVSTNTTGPIQNYSSVTYSTEITSNSNVKTGIKGLKPVIIILIVGTIAYYLMKRNNKKIES